MKKVFLQLVAVFMLAPASSCVSNTSEQPKATNTAPSSPQTGVGRLWVSAPGASTQIHRLEEMNTEQLRALQRDKTVVVMPGAYKGEHGPYLPNVDSFRNERLAWELANAIALRPGWHVVMFPFIPLGQGGANELRSEEHTSELQSLRHLVCRLLLE